MISCFLLVAGNCISYVLLISWPLSLNAFTKRLSDFSLSVSSRPVPYSGQDVCANTLAPSGADDGCRVGRAVG
jgi:hypothetical protein